MVSSPRLPTGILSHHPLAPLTTFEVGGAARFYAELCDLQLLRELCGWAECMQLPILPLGEGSNLLVSDAGYPGLALRWTRTGWQVVQDGPEMLVRVEGGTRWDDWVAQAVAQDWAGVECLSGIPGSVGASPIQNIGAYGQEACESIESVEVLERKSGGEVLRFSNPECQFSYRHSAFKAEWKDRYFVTAVFFRLTKGGRPNLRYGDLTQALSHIPSPDLQQVRQAVLQVRRSKSMLHDPADPNHRSAGSFFINPVVEEAVFQAITAQFPPGSKIPNYPASPGTVKLSAAWLIEKAGFPKGYAKGRAALSSNHVLALTNRGGASSQDIVELAAEIRRGVFNKFAVVLEPETQLVGFAERPPEWALA